MRVEGRSNELTAEVGQAKQTDGEAHGAQREERRGSEAGPTKSVEEREERVRQMRSSWTRHVMVGGFEMRGRRVLPVPLVDPGCDGAPP